MIIYSSEISAYLLKIKALAFDILKNEMQLEVQRKRVLYKGRYYPLNFVVFEDKSKLGFYDANIYQIGIAKIFMSGNFDEEVIKNVIRHELAHFLCDLKHGSAVQDHGSEFKSIFSEFNWDKSFSKASIDMARYKEAMEHSSKKLEKVQKLLSLAKSDNIHEAQLALERANKIITQHGLSVSKDETETSYVAKAYSFKRKNTLVNALYEIISNFNVSPVFNQGNSGGYLEIIGTKEDVEIAEYIIHYIAHSIESIWKNEKLRHGLKGITAKNSFIRGFSAELTRKIKEQKQMAISTKELVRTNNTLAQHMQRVYPRLRKSSATITKQDDQALKLGRSTGRKFSIKPALKSGKKSTLLLNFFK